MHNKIKIVIGQLGSPKSTKTSDVRSYLREFLGDPRVVDINPLLWKIILNLFVLPFRPKKSAQAYARIYDGESFPLITITEDFAEKLSHELDPRLELNHCFLLSEPRAGSIFAEWNEESEFERATKVVVLPQFPQYSEATIASVFDVLAKGLEKQVNIPSIDLVHCYHKSKAFIDNSVRLINDQLKESPVDEFVISFHGIPLRRVLQKKDIYYTHCFETFLLIRERVDVDKDKVHFTFQSRFGSEQWLGPATDDYCVDLVEKGSKRLGIYAPSFVVDCLETTDELGTELREEVEEVGGSLICVPCLNTDEKWIKDYAHFVNTYALESKEKIDALFYEVKEEDVMAEIPEQKQKSPPLSGVQKSVLKMMFLTLFMDLIGFSIIFPLFPSLAKYYTELDPDNYFLNLIFGGISNLTSYSGGVNVNAIVLFGGALGALYSLLQFIAAPIWGALSDKFGRKPILLVSVFGLFISYVLWFFSGSFTTLVIARIIGGIMGGNISTASAVVADVTDKKTRSKGMAFIGIAFAFGFILGPALGGIFSSVNLMNYFPSLVPYGLNPFSLPALIAAVLSFINLFYIAFKFKETHPKENRGSGDIERTANPLRLFQPLPYKGVNLTNFAYFLFISAFSGMEFTLTFLAVEKLSFSSMDNAYMFIFIGFIIALVQGGYVRRKAVLVGEAKMALQGLTFLIPGLVIIGLIQNTFMLYIGLFFLAAGSAMAIPTITSLVSLFTPSEEQGRSLGIFRSLGALGRVVGPIIASILYWRLGASMPYFLGAASMIMPILILMKIKKINEY